MTAETLKQFREARDAYDRASKWWHEGMDQLMAELDREDCDVSEVLRRKAEIDAEYHEGRA